jgi:hypothetical protein
MKTREITLKLILELDNEAQKIAISKDGRILQFKREPALHVISDWSNKYLLKEFPIVKNYKDIVISVH